MQFSSDKQRRAAFFHMAAGRPHIRGFPIYGRGGLARRNRAILGAVGLAAGGTALVATAAYSRGGLAKLLLSPAEGYHYKSPSGLNLGGTFTSMRQPGGAVEEFLARHRLFGQVRHIRIPGRKGIQEAVEVHSVPLLSRAKIALTRGITRAGRHIVDTDNTGAPIMRSGYRKAGGLVNRLAQSVDNASIWRMLGRGKLYGNLTEDSRFAAKEGVRRLIKRGENFLIAPRRVLTKTALKQLKDNQALARANLKIYRKEAAALETTLKGRPNLLAVVTRKHAARRGVLDLLDQEYNQLMKQRLVKPSRLERGVHIPLNALRTRVNKADRSLNRGARKVGRTLGLPT